MTTIKKILVCSFLSTLSLAHAELSPYDAARHGDLEALRKYRFNGIDLFVPDQRGFIPYELAALNADPDKAGKVQKHVELMLWLKEFNSPKHRYGKASVQLVQAGLQALGYPISHPDGVMGEKTADAIRDFQTNNGLATTGRLGPQWLGLFFQDILKDVQYKLTKLGFDTHGTDGLMGTNTEKAFLKYRQRHHLSNPDYPYLDALLVTSVNSLFDKKQKGKKAKIAKKEQQTEKQLTRYVQAGLSALGYRIGKVDGVFGSKTANAIKNFQKKYHFSVTGETDVKTLTKMNKIFLSNTQKKFNALGYNVGKPDGLMGSKTQKAILRYRKTYKLGSRLSNDAELMEHLNSRYTQHAETQQAQAREAKEEKQQLATQAATNKINFAQAGLRTLGYISGIDGIMGSQTIKAVKRFQKRYKIPNNGKLGPMTTAKMQTIFLKESQRKLNTLGYKVGKPDGKMGSATRSAFNQFAAKHGISNQFNANLIAAIDDSYDQHIAQKRKAVEMAKAKKATKKTTTVDKKSVVKKTEKAVASSQSKAKPVTKTTIGPITKTIKTAAKAKKKQASKDIVITASKPKKTLAKVSKGNKQSKSVRSRNAKGRMNFKRKGGRVVGCSLAGRRIPIEWCEPFYPLPKKNRCEATFKPSNGEVINLWCK